MSSSRRLSHWPQEVQQVSGGASMQSQVSPWPLGSAASLGGPTPTLAPHSASCRGVGERGEGVQQKSLGWLRLFWLLLVPSVRGAASEE